MRLQIATRHGHVSDEVRERTETLVSGLTKYDPRVSAAEIVFNEEKNGCQVEVILHTDGDEPVVAHAEEADFRAAADKVVDRLSRMLRKRRDRRRDHQHAPLSEGK